MIQDKTVLVVEDDPTLRFAIQKKLQINGFKILTASSVEEAEAQLQNSDQIDAIWLDHYLLGNESGLSLVAFLKKRGSRWKSVPLFVVSNTASPEKVKAYIRYGITKYFVKAECRLAQVIIEIKSVLKINTNLTAN